MVKFNKQNPPHGIKARKVNEQKASLESLSIPLSTDLHSIVKQAETDLIKNNS